MRLALVHGFTQTGRSWAPLVPGLEAAGHEVVCPDAPGHGDAADVELDLPGAATYLAERVGRAVWVGYSMGGRLCLHLALQYPEVLEGLVCVSTTAGIADEAERAQRRLDDNALADEIESDGVPAFIDRWLAGPLWSTLPPEMAGKAERLTNHAHGLASSLRLTGTGAQAPLWDRLAAIDAPTLVITGDLDPKFTALGDRLAEGVGINASRRRIADAGHALPWEQPAAFVHAVNDWLLTVPRAPGRR